MARGAHYIAQVKANHPGLFDRIRRLPWREITLDHHERTRAHQRLEIRRLKTVAFAHHYIDSDAQAPGAALRELGGADLIVHTASPTAPVDELLTGLSVHGQLTLVGVDTGSVTVPAAQLVMNGHTLTGHLTGSPCETEEAVRFAVTNGVRPMIERMPLEQAGQAVTRLASGAEPCPSNRHQGSRHRPRMSGRPAAVRALRQRHVRGRRGRRRTGMLMS
ncbi:zinc-binding dehydrogenase [Streptomyces violaceusniger]